MRLSDGTGRGYEAKVDSNNRLVTYSITQTEVIDAAKDGDAFNINTGLITGIASDSALIYFYNGEDRNFVIETLIIGSFDGITHSNDPYIILYSNITGGDIISDASAVTMNANRNFGSTRSLAESLAYKGKNGGTMTGGTEVAYVQLVGGSRSSVPLNFILPKGSSIGIKLIANVSSGSASYYAAIVGYLEESL